jgi:pyridoxamine 5'-phosphate oxidase
MSDFQDLSRFRKNYELQELRKNNLNSDPNQQFSSWFGEAVESGSEEANAMTLATSNTEGRPSLRVVLLKEYSSEGFVFYSNYRSRKGIEISVNPYGSLLFWWKSLERQVRIEGQIQKIESQQSLDYFQSRPRGSQIAAHASSQSAYLPNKLTLENKVQDIEDQFKKENHLPLPNHWGGYILVPDYFEFWQGRPNRLHDRFAFIKSGKSWSISRLSP